MSNKKITDEELEEAKRMYMEYSTPSQICSKIGLKKTTLHYWIKKWLPERELLKAELFAQMSNIKKVQFTEVSNATIKIMQKALVELANRKEAPSMHEAKTAAAILETIDKITRLDDGNPTDIVSDISTPLTVEAVRKKLAVDPFSDEELVEYKPVEGKENEND